MSQVDKWTGVSREILSDSMSPLWLSVGCHFIELAPAVHLA